MVIFFSVNFRVRESSWKRNFSSFRMNFRDDRIMFLEKFFIKKSPMILRNNFEYVTLRGENFNLSTDLMVHMSYDQEQSIVPKNMIPEGNYFWVYLCLPSPIKTAICQRRHWLGFNRPLWMFLEFITCVNLFGTNVLIFWKIS